MTEAPPLAGDLFQDLVATFGQDQGPDRPARRGFGSDALMVNGKMFAAPQGEKLLLKLPSARVSELVVSGRGEPFTAGKQRAMAEWVLVGPGAHNLWPTLAAEARAFVGTAASKSWPSRT